MSVPVTVRLARSSDDRVVADHFRQMWLDNDIPENALVATWRDRTQSFLDLGRAEEAGLGFIAEAGAEPVGSLVAQRHADLYPEVLDRGYRHYAYIWGVYVQPAWRRRGVASALVGRAVKALSRAGYSRVYLHATEMGRPVYERAGFVPSNELRLDL